MSNKSQSGMFHVSGGDMNSGYIRNTFSAISAEAGLASTDSPTSYSATVGLMNIFNQAASAGDYNVIIHPRMLNLVAKSANTSATDFRLHFYRDTADRYSSGGTELTPAVTSFDDSASYANHTAKARINAGLLALGAAGSDEEALWRAMCKDEVFAAGEGLTILWGGPLGGSIDSAAFNNNVIVVPPMPIGRGQNLSIHEVAASQAADPKFQFQFWFEEHGHTRT